MKRLVEDQEDCSTYLQAMMNSYDGIGTFSEFVKSYTQEHPSKYDFTAMAQFVIPLSDPRYRSEKEKIMNDKIVASALAPVTPDIELVTTPYACFSVKLQEVTFDAIQQALEKAYLEMRANPVHLFCNKQDREKIEADVLRYGIRRLSKRRTEETPHIAQIATLTTGRLVYVRDVSEVPLFHRLPEPDNQLLVIDDGTLLFGFLEKQQEQHMFSRIEVADDYAC